MASVCRRRSRSPTSFSSGSTARRLSSRASSSATCCRNAGSCRAVAVPLLMSASCASSFCRCVGRPRPARPARSTSRSRPAAATATARKTPTCTFHGSLFSAEFHRFSVPIGADPGLFIGLCSSDARRDLPVGGTGSEPWQRVGGLERELDQLGRRAPGPDSTWLSRISTGRRKYALCSRFADEIRQRRQRRAAAVDRQLAAVLLHSVSHSMSGTRLAQFVDHVDGARLPLAQLLDQLHALLQLLLLLVEGASTCARIVLSRAVSRSASAVSVVSRACSRSSAHHHQPIPSAVATRIRLQTSVTFWPMSKPAERLASAFRVRRRGG